MSRVVSWYIYPEDSTNSPQDLGRLPSDILLECFLLLREIEPPVYGLASIKRGEVWVSERVRTLGWIKVTHVCRHWRESALSFATLWTCIPGTVCQKLLTAMLTRAQTMPLTVVGRIRTSLEQSPIIRRLCSDRMSQIRELRLHAAYDVMCDASAVAFMRPAPILEYLVLSAEGSFQPYAENRPMTLLTPSTFSETAPRLRSVELRLLPFPQPNPIFENLSSFAYILDDRQAGRGRPWACLGCTPSQLLDVLSSMPSVQTLRLHNCFWMGLHHTNLPSSLYSPVVLLSKLSNLDIVESNCGCIVIMRSIRFPASALVAVQCQPYVYLTQAMYTNTILALFDRLFSAWRNACQGDCPTLRTVSLNTKDNTGPLFHPSGARVLCHGWRRPLDAGGDPDFYPWKAKEAVQPDLTIDVILDSYTGTIPWSIVARVISFVDTSTVDTLSVRFLNSSPYERVHWEEFVILFTSVQDLMVTVTKITPGVLKLLLLYGTPEYKTQDPYYPTFPLLSRLALRTTIPKADAVINCGGPHAHSSWWRTQLGSMADRVRAYTTVKSLGYLSLNHPMEFQSDIGLQRRNGSEE